MAEVTYYYNVDPGGGWSDYAYMVDGSLDTFAYTSLKASVQENNGNNCPSDDLGTIIKVEFRCYGYGDGDDQIELKPRWDGGVYGDPHLITMPSITDWSIYVDITNDTNHPDWSSWSQVQAIIARVIFRTVAKGNTMYCAKVEIRVTYTPAGIDVTIDAPLVGVDSEGKGPSMSLGLSLSPLVVASDSQGLAPSLVRDRIFQAPVATVDGEGKIPSLSLGLGISPPIVSIDSEAKVPSFVRDMIFGAPLVPVDCEAKVPTPSLSVILSSPVAVLDSEALVASILTALVISAPTVAIDSEGLTPSLAIDRIFTSPLVSVESEAITPTLSLSLILLPPTISVDSAAPGPILGIDRIFTLPLVAIDSEALVPAIVISGAVTIIVPLVGTDVTALVPAIGGGRRVHKRVFELRIRPGRRMGFYPSLKV